MPGWNAVHVALVLSPADPETVLSGVSVESIWMWNPQSSTAQFITNANELTPKHPDWLVYFPQGSPNAFLSTLHAIEGGRPYLVRLGGTLQATWKLRGRPIVRDVNWRPDAFTLVGFPVGTPGPKFEDFFTPSTAHVGQPIYTLKDTGLWQEVTELTGDNLLESGKSYWVYTKGESKYQGPTRVRLEQSQGLAFSNTLTEQVIRVKNETMADEEYTLALQESKPPTDPTAPALAGGVPLSYWQDDYAHNDVGWRPLAGELKVTVKPGKEKMIRLAVRRPDMAPYTPKAGETDFQYQGVLSLSDRAGTPILLPLSARGLGALEGSAVEHDPRTGLWVGTAVVMGVTEHSENDPDEPQATSSEFQFRLIVHVDKDGNPKLLQQVVQMWKPGKDKEDPQHPGQYIPDVPGEFVLITDPEVLAQYQNLKAGAALRDGTPVGRRISSTAFGFKEPHPMTGKLPTTERPETTVSCKDNSGTGGDDTSIKLAYNDPLNPFVHKYHPDHDNLKESFEPYEAPYLETESYAVKREIELRFTSSDPDQSTRSGWGDTQLGGIYWEKIRGLHKQAITVQGTFRLAHVCAAGTLNPPIPTP